MNPAFGGVTEAINQAALSVDDDSQMDVLCFDEPSAPWVKNNSYQVFAIGGAFSSYGVNFGYFKWLFKNAKHYDVVVFDGLWQFFIIGGYLLKLLKVPYFVYTHGMLDPYFNLDRIKYIKKLPVWFCFERNVIAMSKGVIFTCKEESELALRSFPFYNATPFISTLGVASPELETSRARETFLSQFPGLKEKQILLFLSRVHPKKGIDLLIDTLFKADLPDNLVFAIAGPGDENYISGLKKKAQQLGVSDRLHWLGSLFGELKWGAYYAADAFVLPSHQENFGIVVAEALSTGTPVLITNKVNIWREIEKSECGFVENDDIAGVNDLLNNWINLSDNEKDKMSINAYKCYTNNFSVDAAKNSLNNVLLTIYKTNENNYD
jgi:glycosyltransferase involved in cell wall biosynthesis